MGKSLSNFSLNGLIRFSVAALAVGCVFGTAYAQNKVLESLERGEVLTNKNGSAILVQALVDKDAAAIKELLEAEDFSGIPSIFENVASIRPFTTSDKKNLVYMKLRGLTDGLGVLMEVKDGPREAFVNARELIKSADFNSRQAAKAEHDQLDDSSAKKDIELLNAKTDTQRMLGVGDVILLEGPLNEVEQMPDLRVTFQISFSPYTILPPATGVAGAATPKARNLTFMQVKAAFGRQVPKGTGELGDYQGFGDARLGIVQKVAEGLVRSAKSRLEKI